MAVFYDINNLPKFANAVLTVGTFDGVHQGHRAILREVTAHAQRIGGESVLFTFEPHPRKLLFPGQPLGIITPLHEKLRLITEAGIHHVVVVPFTHEFAALTAEEYVANFLVGVFHPASIVIGYDHRFGHDRKGDIHLLRQLAPKWQYDVTEIHAQLIDEATVSSTKIRHALAAGTVGDAAAMLGRYYTLKGLVVHGKKLGRQLGYPTANLQPLDPDQVIPGIGIYAVRASVAGVQYDAMLSVGYNPTVNSEKVLHIEANLFGFDADIYGQELELTFVQRLRGEQKFDSLDALIAQLHEDKRQSIAVLAAIS